ncbi:phosphoribosylamine--glycine ligase [Candidatus Microgenomates bacterium]|nr:phosphoribosylamine--glycine ligase [Candidatus Microgenomates bacterium]
MKILVIGSGGREHAFVWKLAQSKRVSKIFCAPGNPGIGQIALNISIQASQLDQLVRFAKKEKIDLIIVGPEVSLISGIVDLFKKNHLNIFGPTEKAARIEGSKVFAKKLMLKYGIPTAKFAIFDDYGYAKTFLKTQKYPLVMKADGQCLGKGVMVCQDEKSAQRFLKLLMIDKTFGQSGNKIIIEECLTGQEVSFMVVTDGTNFVSLLPSQDHKPVFDGDRGPNTGGMGAYAPVPFIDKKLISRIEKEIIGPTISAMAKEGCLYKGILYPGLILTKDGPKVLEYNCRFGDPETQPLMMMLKTDLIDIFEAVLKNKVKSLRIKWFAGSAVCVVLTSKGYPGNYEKGKEIVGLTNLDKKNDLQVFHAGTKIDNGKIVSSGGRVLGITGRDKNLRLVIKKVYKTIGKKGVHFSGMQYRKDIGKKGLKKKLWN